MSPTFTLNDGAQISWLGFGTGTALYHKDSADAENEESLGQGIKDSGVAREKVFVTTKVLKTLEGESVKATLKGSLKRLGLDYVDLFLIHSPTAALKAGGKAGLRAWWKEMEELKKEGLAKSIGVSNFAVEHMEIILEDATIIPAVNQIELHPYVWDTASQIYDFCKSKNIVIESYAALSSIFRASGGPVDPVLANVAARLRTKESDTTVSPGQVIFKWLIQKGVVVVTTSSKVSRIREALSTPSLPDLTEEEMATIETEGSKVHERFFVERD
ncbi:oxidoreductase [Lentinula aciculospora]|uniref:Oxidoreductase n=1 Tax=Lentinula aciculospora TaxID=153920 RepID=A0A9W9DW55_9AGAR|nr:oxidoreductase [Lentinula aciculospora]